MEVINHSKLRDFKFRFWDPKENLMMYFDIGDPACWYDYSFFPSLMIWCFKKDVYLDDIYEGDILQDENGRLYLVPDVATFLGFMERNHGWSHSKVIGNQYESPELLENDDLYQPYNFGSARHPIGGILMLGLERFNTSF